MEIKNIISVVTVVAFSLIIFFSKNVKKHYLLFVVFLFPFMDLFITTQNYGGFKVFHFITYITAVLFIGKSLSFNKYYTIYPYTILIFCVFLFLSSLHSEFVSESLISLSQYLSIFFYAALLLDVCYDDPKFVFNILEGLKFSCILSLIFLLLQLIFGLSVALYKLNPNTSGYDILIRYPSYFEDPQKYGQFLAICSFLFLIPNSIKKSNSYKNILFFILVIIALFLSGVRAAFTGLCAGMALVFILGNNNYKLLGILLTSVLLFIVNSFGKFFALFNRESDVHATAAVRYAYWESAFKIFLKNPFWGIGVGNYQHYVSLHSQDQYWLYFGTFEYMDHPESGYLKFLVEFGICGFLLMMSFLIFPLISAIKRIVYNYPENKLLLFMTASVISWLVAFATVYSFSDIRIFLLIVTLLSLIIIVSSSNYQSKIVNENH